MKIKISNEKNVAINPNMIGLFFEDINYAADGGLHAELIENRSFSFVRAEGDFNDYCTVPDGKYAWSEINENRGKFRIVGSSPLSKANPYYARCEVKESGFGISNKAYEGLFLKKGQILKVYIWARLRKYEGSIKAMVSKDGKAYGEVCFDKDSYSEEKYNFFRLYQGNLVVAEDVKAARFDLVFDACGAVELGFVSLKSADAVAGVFRKDLFDLLKELHPGFIRFPGGCIVEGNTLENRYDFKNTLKPHYERQTNWNRWAVHGTSKERDYVSDYAWYNQTYGLGFYEYFLLCDMIGAKPLPVLNVGFACQYQSLEQVSRDSEEFKAFLQDALDLIEFANGDATSEWGSVRAKMGHPEPFNLEFLGIGNEQWQTETADFFERYLDFEKTIHSKYPDIKLIGSAGPDITSNKYEMAWDFYRKHKDENNFAYALDEHYYVKPEYLFEHNDFYDNYDREIKVFSGEYAAHPFSGFNRYDANTLYGALSEAAFMTGVERNADVVVLASYAPLFARVNYAQWAPDMIWFNEEVAYGSPSYHVQKMYANNMGDYTIKVFDVKEATKEGIYYNVSFDSKTGQRIIKIVNSNDKEVMVDFEVEGSYSKVNASTLSGPDKDSYNYIDEPLRVSTTDYMLDTLSKVTLKPYSFNVYRF